MPSLLHRVLETSPVDPLTPEQAVTFFRGLVPTLGTDPQRFGADQRRHAFTLAKATETDVLERVQKAIGNALAGGESGRTTAGRVDDILNAAGLGRDGAYAEMVVRTNAMDALNQGIEDEAADPDIAEIFPVWEYMNPEDSRSRPEHAARNGQYYPASVTLDDVRGREIGDKANCRCVKRPVFIDDWLALRAQGKRIAAGYVDPVPTMKAVQQERRLAARARPAAARAKPAKAVPAAALQSADLPAALPPAPRVPAVVSPLTSAHRARIDHFLANRRAYTYDQIAQLVNDATSGLSTADMKALAKDVMGASAGTSKAANANALRDWLNNVKAAADQSAFDAAGRQLPPPAGVAMPPLPTSAPTAPAPAARPAAPTATAPATPKRPAAPPAATPVDPMTGHPLAGLTADQQRGAIEREIYAQIREPGRMRNVGEFAAYVPPQGAGLADQVLSAVRTLDTDRFLPPTIEAIYRAVHPSAPTLTIRQLHGILARLANEDKLRLEPYGRSLTQVERPEFVLPISGEPIFYVFLPR